MLNKDTLIHSAVTAFLVLIAAGSSAADTNAAANSNEKCYGIAKSGMNDCSTATASCAGSSTKDKQKDAFLFLPKGLCAKIAGGNLKPE